MASSADQLVTTKAGAATPAKYKCNVSWCGLTIWAPGWRDGWSLLWQQGRDVAEPDQ
jgi:hypothetical protein